MKINVWFAWLTVLVAVGIAVTLRLLVQPSNWVLGGVMIPALLAIGFILGGTETDEPGEPEALD